MRARLTPTELGRLRRSCRVAAKAYEEGRAGLRAGIAETHAASQFRTPLSRDGIGFEDAHRADGFAFCMAGTHSGQAYGAYARSRATAIQPGDLVLAHCNSHTDGYWTDITRTYCMGNPDSRQQRMYEAVLQARRAALDTIRPGAKASDVDRAARDVLRDCGFADQFKHSTGHGVGFSAIDHAARPCIHPKSDDVLETGMVFNVEPAVYFEDFGGIRHCDMVAVVSSGAELLTPFHSQLEDLIR